MRNKSTRALAYIRGARFAHASDLHVSKLKLVRTIKVASSFRDSRNMVCPMLEKHGPQEKPSSELSMSRSTDRRAAMDPSRSSSTNPFLFAVVVCLAYTIYIQAQKSQWKKATSAHVPTHRDHFNKPLLEFKWRRNRQRSTAW